MKKKISIAIVLTLLLTLMVGCDAASASKASPLRETETRNTAFTLKARVTEPAAGKQTEKNEKPTQDEVDAEGAMPAQTDERRLTVRVTAVKGKTVSYESFSEPEVMPEREQNAIPEESYDWDSGEYDDRYTDEYEQEDSITDEELYAALESWLAAKHGRDSAKNGIDAVTDEEFYDLLEDWLAGKRDSRSADEFESTYTPARDEESGTRYSDNSDGYDDRYADDWDSRSCDGYDDRYADYYNDWYYYFDYGGYDYDDYCYGDYDYGDYDYGDYENYADDYRDEYDEYDAGADDIPEIPEQEIEKGSLTISDKSILFKREDGEEKAAKLSDIEVGAVLELTLDEDGVVTRIVIREAEDEAETVDEALEESPRGDREYGYSVGRGRSSSRFEEKTTKAA